MGRRAYVAADSIAGNTTARHGDIGEDIVHIPLCGITGADDLAAIRLAAKDFITEHDVQFVLLTQTSHVVTQRGVPTGVVAVAITQTGIVVTLTVGLTSIPTLTLAPVAAQVEFGLTHQTGDDLPGKGIVHTDAIAVVDILIVVEDGHRVVVSLGIGTTHAKVAGHTRTQGMVDGVEGVGLCGIAILTALEAHLTIAQVHIPLQGLGDVLSEFEVTVPATETGID